MDWKAILAAVSGPFSAIVRHGITAAVTAVATKYAIDGATTDAVITGLVAVVNAGVGALTASKPVKQESLTK